MITYVIIISINISKNNYCYYKTLEEEEEFILLLLLLVYLTWFRSNYSVTTDWH